MRGDALSCAARENRPSPQPSPLRTGEREPRHRNFSYCVIAQGHLLALALSLLARTTSADESPAPATHFPRGTFSLTLEADYGHSFDLSPTRFESGLVGVGYYFFDNISISAEAAGFSVQQPGPDSIITEIDLKLRHHLYNSGRFSFYLDAGAASPTQPSERRPAEHSTTTPSKPGPASHGSCTTICFSSAACATGTCPTPASKGRCTTPPSTPWKGTLD